jgi:NAD(P)-dependent dehydrogenase (short-subunit alcohol dehydrogenase family)
VTGGNSGIGRAVATALADRGAHVSLSGRDAGRGELAVAAIRAAGGTADFVTADLGNEASARSLARQAEDLGGGHVDILVAELAPKMAARGNGTIVNVTTMVAEFGMANMALYGSSKAHWSC